MITIRRYTNVAEAGFAQSLLISEGIDAFLADEEAGALGPQFVPWGMRLQVRQEDVQRATQILVEKEEQPSEPAPAPVTPPPKENPGLKCPGCGAEWALTDEEMDRPSFSCPDCGTPIPHEAEIAPVKTPAWFDWRCFLPASDKKWVFILAIVAYTSVLARLMQDITSPLTGANDYLKQYVGWGPVLSHVFSSVILTPIWETLLLVAIIELLRRLGARVFHQAFLSAVALCVVDGYNWWPHGVDVFPFFIICGYVYLYWRPTSWKTAISIVILIHTVGNCIPSIWLICTQVDRDRTSLLATGDAFSWDNADPYYVRSGSDLQAGRVPEAIDSLRKAISIYPYDERYHAGLALALKRAGRMDQADEEYRAAIELNSQYTDAWMGLTSLLYKEHRYSEALDACKHAIPAAPPYDRPGIQAWLRTLTPLVSGTSP